MKKSLNSKSVIGLILVTATLFLVYGFTFQAHSLFSTEDVNVKITQCESNPSIDLENVRMAIFDAQTHAFVDSAYTDANGTYTFNGIYVGSFQLFLSKPGYLPKIIEFDVVENAGPLNITVCLELLGP